MPSKNSRKLYKANGVYHLYNRGVEKRNIFLDFYDYKKFLFLLSLYLNPKSINHDINYVSRYVKNYADEIDLLAFCLMPNHFHLLIRQKNTNSVSGFMHCIGTSYSTHFNRRYERSGTLFQGRYKGVLLDNDNQLLHVSRYIHLNPVRIGIKPEEYKYSSFAAYLNNEQQNIINKDIIHSYFSQPAGKMNPVQAYKEFVMDQNIISDKYLGELTLD